MRSYDLKFVMAIFRRLPRFWGCYVYFNNYLLIVMKDSVLNLIGNVNSLVRGTNESYEN